MPSIDDLRRARLQYSGGPSIDVLRSARMARHGGITLSSEFPPEAVANPALQPPPQSTLTAPPMPASAYANQQEEAEDYRLRKEIESLSARPPEGATIAPPPLGEPRQDDAAATEEFRRRFTPTASENAGDFMDVAGATTYGGLTLGYAPGIDQERIAKKAEMQPTAAFLGDLVGLALPAIASGGIATAATKAPIVIQALAKAPRAVDALTEVARARQIAQASADIAALRAPAASVAGRIAQEAGHGAATGAVFTGINKDPSMENLKHNVAGFGGFTGAFKALGEAGAAVGRGFPEGMPRYASKPDLTARPAQEAMGWEVGPKPKGIGPLQKPYPRAMEPSGEFLDEGIRLGPQEKPPQPARVPFETVPGTARGFFPEYHKSPNTGAKMALDKDLSDALGTKDVEAVAPGVPSKVYRSFGEWEGTVSDNTVLELPAGTPKEVVEALTNIRSALFAQDAGMYFKGVDGGGVQGYTIQVPGIKWDRANIQRLADAVKAENGPKGLTVVGDGAKVVSLDFDGAFTPQGVHDAFEAALRKSFGDDAARMLDVEVSRFDANLIGKGEVADDVALFFKGQPDLQEWVVRRAEQDLASVYSKYAEVFGRDGTELASEYLATVRRAVGLEEAAAGEVAPPKPTAAPRGKKAPQPFTAEGLSETFGIPSEQAVAVKAFTDAFGVDLRQYVSLTRGGRAGKNALAQVEALLAGDIEELPAKTKKTLGPAAKAIDTYVSARKVFPGGLSKYSDAEIVKRIAEHTRRELGAHDKLAPDYVPFYDVDVPEANKAAQIFARQQYGRELKPEELDLMHLLGSLSSAGATPTADARAGLLLLHRYITTGELRGDFHLRTFEPKPKGLKKGEPWTPVPREELSQIATKFNQRGLRQVKKLIDDQGSLKAAMDWMKAPHSAEEIARFLGVKPSQIPHHENLSRVGESFGAFAIAPAKQGSYFLNRAGEFSTVTKDLWYARTMARLTGQRLISKGKVVAEPWTAKTQAGVRLRKLADEAWEQVAKDRGTTPADIQQRMWDFEKRVWEKVGHKEPAQTISAGVRSGANRVGDLLAMERGTKKFPKTAAEEKVYWQEGKKASVEFPHQGELFDAAKALIRAYKGSDVSSAIHESAHVIRRLVFNKEVPQELRPRVSDKDIEILETWAKVVDGKWSVEAEEKFARAIERYLRDGVAPTKDLEPIFAQFKEWMRKIYTRIKGSAIDVKISPEVRAVFDKALGKDLGPLKAERAKLIEKGVPRSEAHRLAKAEAAPPAAGEAIPVPESRRVNVEQPPGTLALQKSTIPEIRDAIKRAELPEHEVQAWTQNLENAKREGLDVNALEIAEEVRASRRAVSADEHAGMVLKAIDLKKQLAEMDARIANLIDAGHTVSASETRAARNTLIDQMDKLTEASDFAGRESARALNIRKMLVNMEDLTVSGALQRAKSIKGSALTPEEALKIEELAGRYQKALAERDAVQAKYEDLVAKREKEIAQKVVNRENNRTAIAARGRAKKGDIAAQRADIKKQIAELGYRLNDITGVTAEGSYLIGKLAVSYIHEGYVTMEALVQKVLADLPDLTDRDVYRALTARDPKYVKRERSDISKRISEMKTHAKLLEAVANAEEGIFPAATKRARPVVPEEIRVLKNRLRELRTQAYKTTIPDRRLERALTKLAQVQDQVDRMYRNVKKRRAPLPDDVRAVKEQIRDLQRVMRVDDQIAILQDQLRTGEFPVKQQKTLKKIPPDLERKEITLKMLRKDVRQAIQELEPKNFWNKQIMGTANALRTMKATADMSGTARQGLILSARRALIDPIGFGKDFGRAVEATFSKTKAEAIDLALRGSENHYLREKAGLELTELGGTRKGEEVFQSRLLQKIPGVKASERHMTTFLNLMRADAFDRFLMANPNATDAELKAIANAINVFSGRGNVGKWAGAVNGLSTVVFAPRFSWSRVQTPYVFIQAMRGSSPRVRAEVAKQIFSTFGLGMSVLSLAYYSGMEVGLDPRDADFGKIKVGNTRIDVWGGLIQPMRVVGAILSIPVERKGWIEKNGRPIDPLDMIGRFASYKLAPLVTTTSEIWTGKDIIGKDVGALDIAARTITPLIIADIIDAAKDAGWKRAATVGGLTFLGVGANTYEKKKRLPFGPSPAGTRTSRPQGPPIAR